MNRCAKYECSMITKLFELVLRIIIESGLFLAYTLTIFNKLTLSVLGVSLDTGRRLL